MAGIMAPAAAARQLTSGNPRPSRSSTSSGGYQFRNTNPGLAGSDPARPQAPAATPVPITPNTQLYAGAQAEGVPQAFAASEMSQYLANQAGVNAMYAAQQNQLQNQLFNVNQAQTAAQAGFLNSAYQNNLALLGADRYRNVDLGHMTNNENRRYITQTWQNLQNFLQGRTSNVEGVWANQQNFYNRMAPLDFNTWAEQRAANLLDTQRDLDSARSDAIGRGAMSSRGYQAGRFNREETSRVADRGFENQYNIRRLNADTTLQGQRLSYQDALNQIRNQFATGQNTYTHGISGVDIQNLALQSLAQTYGLRGEQLAIQLQQALSGNAAQSTTQSIQNQLMNSQFSQSSAQAILNAIQQQLALRNG